MKLYAADFAKIEKALLDAFDPSSFSRMLKSQLGADIAHITGAEAGFAQQIHGTLRWAEHNDRIEEIVAGAKRVNQSNKLLQALSDTYDSVATSDELSSIQNNSPSIVDRDGNLPADIDPFVLAFNKKRVHISEHYERMSTNAKHIDIISLTMEALLEIQGGRTIRNWVTRGARVRILIPMPYSAAATLRSKQERLNMSAKSIKNIRYLKTRVFDQIQTRISLDVACLGSLELRLYNGIPYFAYHKADNEMIIGLYYSHRMGMQSDSLYIGAKSRMFDRMQQHFETIWRGDHEDASVGERTVCKISEHTAQFMDISTLEVSVD